MYDTIKEQYQNLAPNWNTLLVKERDNVLSELTLTEAHVVIARASTEASTIFEWLTDEGNGQGNLFAIPNEVPKAIGSISAYSKVIIENGLAMDINSDGRNAYYRVCLIYALLLATSAANGSMPLLDEVNRLEIAALHLKHAYLLIQESTDIFGPNTLKKYNLLVLYSANKLRELGTEYILDTAPLIAI